MAHKVNETQELCVDSNINGANDYNFHSEYSVIIDHPISEVFPVLGHGDRMGPVVRLSALCAAFDLLELDSVVIPHGQSLEQSKLVRALPSTPRTLEATSPDSKLRMLPRQFFRLQEDVTVFLGFKRKVIISGAQTWDEDEKTILYESTAPMGVSVWKFRRFEEMKGEDGKKRTRVSEKIKGQCPALLKFIVQRQTSTGHRAHMDSYHTLFDNN